MVLGGTLFLVIAVGFAASDCPSHWEHHGNRCYFFSHDTETWQGARVTCSYFQSQMCELMSEEENAFVTKTVSTMNHDYWIGAADILIEGEWVWYNTRQIIDNTTYSNWAAGGLDNANDNENCAQIGVTGTWHDAKCDTSNYYICERSVDHSGEVFG